MELHSITGLFYEDFPGISPWGGYFIRGLGEENNIEGMLADVHGLSRIDGKINSDLLEFRKQYGDENMGQVYDYRFQLKNGIWLGEYTSSEFSSYSGRSLCKTNLCLKDLNFKNIAINSPEDFVRVLIDNMVNSGKIELINDPKSGEEYIRPVD